MVPSTIVRIAKSQTMGDKRVISKGTLKRNSKASWYSQPRNPQEPYGTLPESCSKPTISLCAERPHTVDEILHHCVRKRGAVAPWYFQTNRIIAGFLSVLGWCEMDCVHRSFQPLVGKAPNRRCSRPKPTILRRETPWQNQLLVGKTTGDAPLLGPPVERLE